MHVSHKAAGPLAWAWVVFVGASLGACFEDVPTDPVASTGTTSSGATSGSSSGVGGATGTGTGEVGSDSTTVGLDDTAGSTGQCPADPTQIQWAQDAQVVSPMLLIPAIYLPGEPLMARSNVPEQGTITFSFEVECATSMSLFGLLWDHVGGTRPDNPDSFYVTIDDGDEWLWSYGCQTSAATDAVWAWLPLVEAAGTDCDSVPVTLELSSGAHQITLRNVEAGMGEDFAAVAAFVLTDDPDFDPATLYDPDA